MQYGTVKEGDRKSSTRLDARAVRGPPVYTGAGAPAFVPALRYDTSADRPMPDYSLEGPKPARMYEVILPKKIGYFGKVQEVLEDLFDEDAVRAIPFVQQSIARSRKRDKSFDEDAWVKTLTRASRGYSIYEMDGRYLSPAGPVDERVLVIRFIFHNAATEGRPANRNADVLAASLEVVNHLVAHRFAQELGVEDEIWFVEYSQPMLAIWRKNVGENKNSSAGDAD